MLPEEKIALELLVTEAGGLFDSVKDHGASADTFMFDHASLHKLLIGTQCGRLVGYTCQVKGKGPWVLIGLEDYERIKDRPEHAFKPVYEHSHSPEVLATYSKFFQLLSVGSLKMDKVNDSYMVSFFPVNRGSLWFYTMETSLVEAIKKLWSNSASSGLFVSHANSKSS